MREALTWALESGERELGLELVVALESYWATNSPHEGADWVVALLAGDPDVPDRLAARALRVQGGQEALSGASTTRSAAGKRRWRSVARSATRWVSRSFFTASRTRRSRFEET